MTKTAAVISLKDAKKAIQAEIEKLRHQAAEKNALLGQYRSELNALRSAPIGFDDYAAYVRQNMRAVAASFPGSCNEGLLDATGGKTPMDVRGWAYFEESLENGTQPNVWQNSYKPISIAVGTVSPWTLLCYLGGQKFEDDVVDGLRKRFATKWERRQAEKEGPYMPVEQRRIRCGELAGLVETETAALRAIQAEIDALVAE